MKTLVFSLKPFSGLLLLGFLLTAGTTVFQSCTPKFDKPGFENAVNLETKLSALISKASEPYSKHASDVAAVQADLEKAYRHAADMKGNKEVTEAWKTLKDELVAPFFARWKEKSKVDPDVVKEFSKQVGTSMTAIKKAEEAKKKKK